MRFRHSKKLLNVRFVITNGCIGCRNRRCLCRCCTWRIHRMRNCGCLCLHWLGGFWGWFGSWCTQQNHWMSVQELAGPQTAVISVRYRVSPRQVYSYVRRIEGAVRRHETSSNQVVRDTKSAYRPFLAFRYSRHPIHDIHRYSFHPMGEPGAFQRRHKNE